MKRFQFSLETLLSLRKEREQECEIALAAAAGELAKIERRIEEARSSGDRAFSTEMSTLDDFRARDLLWMKSVKDCKSLEKPRQEAAGKMNEARKKYNRAHSERTALDKLREKRMEQWKFKVKQEEIKRLDETAKGADVRKRLTGGDE
jgi:flagellar FliJ protein